MRPNVSYVVEAYAPDGDGGVVKEAEVATRGLANETAQRWADEGYEADIVRRDWYSAQRIEYITVAIILPAHLEN